MHIFSIVPTCSGGIDEDVVVVGRDSPVLGVIVLLGVVFLVVSEEGVKLEALLEVLDGFEASDVLEEVEVTVSVNTSTDKSVPVDAL